MYEKNNINTIGNTHNPEEALTALNQYLCDEHRILYAFHTETVNKNHSEVKKYLHEYFTLQHLHGDFFRFDNTEQAIQQFQQAVELYKSLL